MSRQAKQDELYEQIIASLTVTRDALKSEKGSAGFRATGVTALALVSLYITDGDEADAATLLRLAALNARITDAHISVTEA